MIIKCKMCGGDIEFVPGATYGTCEYCGSTSTIPKADDEQKLNRYNRANHLRRQCEFDKALAAYEKILEQDDTDAEAHWGAALSRYGIEYVEDPATQKRIPTCHRVQVASILADADYLAAVENAPDAESRRLYEEQAAQIAEIQKGILAISANEKPYEVFICYKETDENGQRTRDSQWAQDVYYGLTDAGYKVFFSRITLEDKLGRQYEPYIFAALNSARVMIVIGSRPEYFNAVWVKNEWSRYLALMANDRTRLLIPCYRDMDPYDLPEELSALQSQDMSKIGFMQDLLRGMKKVLDAGKKPDAAKNAAPVAQTASAVTAPGIASLLERAYLFMEDGDFASATEYLNRVLDIDPKYAPAYAAKACVAFGFRREADLANATVLYADNADWQKALRFADAQQKAVYDGYYAQAKKSVAAQIRSYAYDCAVEMAVNPQADRRELEKELSGYRNACNKSAGYKNGENTARRVHAQQNEEAFQQAVRLNEPGDVSEQGYKDASEMFAALKDEEGSACAKQCLALAEQVRQEAIYIATEEDYCRYRGKPMDLDRVAQRFLSISGYEDAAQRAQDCLNEAETERNRLYNNVQNAIQNAGADSRKWWLICSGLSKPELRNYRDVDALRQKAEARYEECLAAEKEKAHQQDIRKKRVCIIVSAAAAVIIAAILLVTKVIIPKGLYEDAMQFRANGEWEKSVEAFASAGKYGDAETQITETHYQHAQSLMKSGDYNQAYALFVTLKGYADVDSLLANDENLLAAAAAAAAARDAMFSAGNYVTFGTYPQTSAGSDQTPIEWLVLDRDGDKALLLSRYGLDAQTYNTKNTSITWEKCTLRAWLNDDFMNRAFTAAEQSAILLTNVDNSSIQCCSRWSTSGGNNTQDKVFLLSYAEANKYLGVTYDNSNNTKSRVAPTAYAILQGAWTSNDAKTTDGEVAGWWWLRSPGGNQHNAARVYADGSLGYSSAYYARGSVRPALWVNLESGIF